MTDTQQHRHTPGPVVYVCKTCGWTGVVISRPRCLACYRLKVKQWRADNPDKQKAMKKRHLDRKGSEYAAHRKRVKRANNPETSRAAWKRRSEWLHAGDVTLEELRSIYVRDNGSCVYCGTDVVPRFSVTELRGFDHVVSRSQGGAHTASNLVVCCGSCNARKSDNG